MSKKTWFTLILFIALSLEAGIEAQGQVYLSHRFLTRGADTAEIYINCRWYEDSNGIIWNGLFYSSDNGKSISPKRKRKWHEESGIILGDSVPGRIFQLPMQLSTDTFGISYDYGVNFGLKYFNNIYYPAAGCMAGEIYIQEAELPFGIYRSVDYGNTFTWQNSDDSLELREVGTLPGELYCYNWTTMHGPLGLAYSNDYGLTFTTSYLEFPGAPVFDECMIYRGAEPGEIYFVIWIMNVEIYLFHSFDYGQTITFQSQLPYPNGEMLYTGGRTPGTFYIIQRFFPYDHSILYIYFSRDYGVTYTTYIHDLDSTYTQIPTQSTPLQPFSCFPNPASNFIQIDLQHPQSEYQVSLWDMQGNIRVSSVLPVGRKQIRLDVSDFHPGIYLLKVTEGASVIGVEKVVVE